MPHEILFSDEIQNTRTMNTRECVTMSDCYDVYEMI